MEKYLNRDLIINTFYNDFIVGTRYMSDDEPDKYALICGWTNKHHQYTRFEKLVDIGIRNKDSVLDIGCGVGEFVNFMKERELKLKYTGIDINIAYLNIAQQRFPEMAHEFFLSDGWGFEGRTYDWAIASGVFTIASDPIFLAWYVGFVMQKIVKKGFAFNLLKKSPHPMLMEYVPDAIVEELRERFPDYKIEMISDYLPDDFTIYIKK